MLKEFGGDFADDDDFLQEVTPNKEDQERLERAYQLEQKTEKLNIFLSESVAKDKISFTIEFVKIKTDSSSILEGAKELLKQKLPEAILEPKQNQNATGSSLLAKVHVKTKEQSHALLSLEGETLNNIKIEDIQIPVFKPDDEEIEVEPKEDEEGEEEQGEEEHDEGEEELDEEPQNQEAKPQTTGTN